MHNDCTITAQVKSLLKFVLPYRQHFLIYLLDIFRGRPAIRAFMADCLCGSLASRKTAERSANN